MLSAAKLEAMRRQVAEKRAAREQTSAPAGGEPMAKRVGGPRATEQEEDLKTVAKPSAAAMARIEAARAAIRKQRAY